MESILEQVLKGLSAIFVTLLGIVIEVSLSHPENEPLQMVVTILGIVMEVRLLQP